MDKKLLAHEKFIKTEIERFELELKDAKNKQEIELVTKNIKDLYNFHQKTVHDFQHERLIHLIVTFFFAGILLVLIIAQFLLTFLPMTYDYTSSSTVLAIVILIFLVTEIFYVRHYYKLENGTQRLYELSKKLYEIAHYS